MHAINAANSMGVSTAGALGVPGMANPMALNQATKMLREVYVGNIPPGITITQLTDFVTNAMKQLNLTPVSPFGGPVASCWISTDGHYAFVEFRTVEEATVALNNLGGMMIGSYQLKVGRPKTNGPGAAALINAGLPLGLGTLMAPSGLFAGQSLGVGGGLGVAPVPLTAVSTTAPVVAATDCIMVSNLPDLGEAAVRELLEPFGEVSQSIANNYDIFAYVFLICHSLTIRFEPSTSLR